MLYSELKKIDVLLQANKFNNQCCPFFLIDLPE